MTEDQVVGVCQKYCVLLNGLGAVPFRNRDASTREGKLNHLRFMCDQVIIEAQSTDSRADTEKVMRWLGFVQGSLYALDLRSIDEMRDDNR